MKTADFIKSSMIARRAYKGHLIVDEVGLPLSEDWTKTHRADLMEVTKEGRTIIYEIKSSMADYRSDKKWHNYENHAELLYFIAPRDVAKVIKEETPSHIGVYELGMGGLSCIRTARKTGTKCDADETRRKLQIQLSYRYAKIHALRQKEERIRMSK